MDNRMFYAPDEVCGLVIESGVRKAGLPLHKKIILGVMGGIFTAMSAHGSSMAAFNLLARLDLYGLGRLVASVTFGTALMLALLAGAEMFVGNSLIITAVLERKVKVRSMLANWGIIFVFNIIGAFLVAFMVYQSGLFASGGGMLGAVTIRVAVAKTSLRFHQAFFLGVMCNCLICSAVWAASAAKETAGKVLASFFIISLFVLSGFENSVANMFYIPAGILAKSSQTFCELSGLAAETLEGLNWGSYITKNLLPVALGNIVGGAGFVGAGYWAVYARKKK